MKRKNNCFLLISLSLTLVAPNLYAQDKIGIREQVWMTQNLSSDTFRDGSSLFQAKSNEEWINALKNKQPAWCYYNNDTSLGTKFGKIYNWYAVNNLKGLAPIGWHIPKSNELTILNEAYKSQKDDGTYTGRMNSLGFKAYLAGYRSPDGLFLDINSFVAWWTLDDDQQNSWSKFGLGSYKGSDNNSDTGKKYGFYVRCVAD
jgi:uncharacterized protein (TIGR02145 family)